MFVLTLGADDRVSAALCLHSGTLRPQRPPRPCLAGRLGGRRLDLRHLRAHPRRPRAICSSTPCGCLAFGSPVAQTIRVAAIHGIHGLDRCRGRRRASRHSFRRIIADGRRLGGDFRRHGRGDTFRVPARRPARIVARSHRGESGSGGAARRESSRSSRARVPRGVVRRQYSVRRRFPLACRVSSSRSHGRHISAGSWPAFWHLPHSIPFRGRRQVERQGTGPSSPGCALTGGRRAASSFASIGRVPIDNRRHGPVPCRVAADGSRARRLVQRCTSPAARPVGAADATERTIDNIERQSTGAPRGRSKPVKGGDL